MRRYAIILILCLVAGLDVQAGKEYTAKPGEQVVANELIIHLMPGSAVATLIAKYLPAAQIQAMAHTGFFRIRVPAGLPSGVSAKIAADLQVDFVEPNRVRNALVAAPNDLYYSSSWWLPAVQALQTWSLVPGQYLTAATAGIGRVKVAVIDTGADCTHPDFINTGGTSTNSAQGGQLMFSASQAIVATTIINPVCPWQDDFGHGTHVTGILAAATSNGTGVSGLAYPVQVIEYKVLNSAGSGNDADIMTAIEAAADAGAQVVSLSLGGVGYSQALQTAIDYAWQRNTLVVAAAGNDSTNELFFPAGANHAVGVSATDSGNNLASFSNFGNSVQLAAPGLGIISTTPTYTTPQNWPLNYASASGTSMATPFVSALAGLVAMTTPNPTAQAILQRMEQTASSTTAGGGWSQNFGYGIINALGAVTGTSRPAANGAISGQIVNSGGSPISGAQITINSQTITTDVSSTPTGLYRFGTLPAGTYSVTVSASGYATQVLSATIAPGADTSFTVKMGVTYGKFTGTVTDQGLGVPGAIVQALSVGLISNVAVADQNGQYTLWAPGGTYDVRASAIGRVTTTVSALTVGAGGTTSANLALPRMGTIAGSVRDGSSNPVANAQVLVTGSSFSAAATTDVNGNYSLIGVPAGTSYSATASAAGLLNSIQNGITVSADVTTSVSFIMASSTVVVPTFNPPAGNYVGTQSVTISTTTVGASIHYTTDGSTPSSTVGIVYSGPVAVSSNQTLKAVAYKTGLADSTVASATYTIQAATPTFTPPAGSYGSTQSVTISTTTAGASIHYTTDGSTPSSTVGTPYSGPVSVSSSVTLKAIAYMIGMADSPVGTASYTITSSGGGPPWYNSSWTNRKAVTVDHTKVSGVGNLTNFPMLFSVTDPNLKTVANGGSVGKVDGTDILFTASDGVTKLNHELEGYNAATGQVTAWVQLPSLSPSADTAVYVYYGNPSAPDQQNRTGVWDSNYKLVWHLANETTLSGADSTSFGNNGTVYGPAAAGEIGGGAGGDVEGTSGTVPGGDQTRTLECWFKITGNTGSDQVLCGMGYDSGNGTIFSLMYRAATSALSLDIKGAARSFSWTADSNWHHIAASYTSGSGLQNAIVYLDGMPQTTTGGTGALTTQYYTYIDVRHSPAYPSDDLTGAVDEFRISNIARPAAWILTGYTNQSSPGTFFNIGGQQTSGGQSQAATPTFNPPAGNYAGTQSVAISTTTAGASIHYTADGSTPSSTVGIAYSAPVVVSSNQTLKAVAYMIGMTDSTVASATYTIQAATPIFNPPAGSYGSMQSVTISTTTVGASIHYTTDGTTPSSTVGTPYSGPVSVSSSVTLKAVAYMTGMADSPVGTASYTITVPAATPTFTPPAGSYGSAQSVTISTTTVGASIHYTTDGTTPSSTVGFAYSAPVVVSSNQTLKAVAYMIGMADSPVGTASYTITVPVATPTFTPPAGSYGSTQSVTISTTTAGASIHYTTDGTTPSSTVGTPYSGPVSVSSSVTLKAIAYMIGMADSPVGTASYTITSSGGGPPWYNSSWTNRKAVTVDHTKVSGVGNLTNFPMLFSVTDPNLKTVANGGSVGKVDGTDILFTASDGVTKLNHELEGYNAATGQVTAWVQLPSLSPSADTAVYVYYGNPSAPDQQNRTGVWDSNYKLVWHLANETTLSGADSTSFGNNGTVYGPAAAGEIGGGAGGDVEGTSGTVPGGDQTRTLECWFKITGNTGSDQVLCGMGYDSGNGTIFSLMYRAATSTLSLDIKGAARSFSWTADSNWHHIAASYTSGSGLQNAVVYLDGMPQTTTGGTGALTTQYYTYIDVRHSPAYPSDDLTGAVDEFRISNIARPPAWILTGYTNQSSPGTFFNIGGQQ